MNLSKRVKFSLVKAAQSSAGTAVDSDSVDMQGYEGVIFLGTMTTANASNFANAATSSDDSSFNDLLDTKITPGTNGDSWLLDIYRPLERYLRCEVDRGGTNTATGEIFAMQYGGIKHPQSPTATIDAELHVTPAEGTA